MSHYILFDDHKRKNFLPLTYTRSISELRCGILTIKEKWNRLLNVDTYTLTEDYLQPLYPLPEHTQEHLFINSRYLPDAGLAVAIRSLRSGEVLRSHDKEIIALYAQEMRWPDENTAAACTPVIYTDPVQTLSNYWDLFKLNDIEIQKDFRLLTEGRESMPIPPGVQAVNPDNIFIEEGAELSICILNASRGVIYIGAGAQVMDGAIIRGSAAICEQAVIKMGAKIYEHTTIGPHCKVGGEVSNVIFHSYSNKGHDGYLGNALIGAWCNLGADTNCSNLKNDYSSVQVWSEAENKKIDTGQQFVGLLMGDHSKCAINTMFNTGTIVGVCCNVFGAGFPPVFIPSFSWGWSEKIITYNFTKAINANNRMMERRQLRLSAAEEEILKNVYTFTEYQRK